MLAAQYLTILRVHVTCVACSGTLFTVRAGLRIANLPIANHRALRRLADLVDTLLLGAAILLTVIVHQYPFVDAWLTTKVLLLLLYIAFGMIALKWASTRLGRLAAATAALLTFAAMVGVAITHRSAGWLTLLSQ